MGAMTGQDWYARDEFYAHLLRDVFAYDMPWALPLLAAGVWSATGTVHLRSILILLGCVLAPFVVPLVTSVPWPRNFLPVVVFLSVLLGVSLGLTLDRLGARHRTRAAAFAMLFILMVAGFREVILQSFERHRWSESNGRPNTLIDPVLPSRLL